MNIRLERFLVGSALLLCLAWSVAYLDFPFGWDQGIAAWIGSLVRAGGVPYRDGWDCSGPLSYFIPALAQILFGHNTYGLRIVDLIVLLTATATLYEVSSRMTDRFCGLLAAIVFYLWYASGSFWHTAQRDGWVAMFMLIGFGPLLVVSTRALVPAMFGAGSAIGLAVLVKPVFGPFLMLPMIFVVRHFVSGQRRLAVASFASMMAGFLIPVVAVIAWFAHHDALVDLLDAYILYPQRVYVASAQPSWDYIFQGLWRVLAPGKIMVVVLPIAVLGAWLGRRTDRSQTTFLVLWALLALAVVILQKRFFLYHWLPAYPPLVILFGLGIYRLFMSERKAQRNSPERNRLELNIVVTIVLLHVAAHPAYNLMSSVAYATGFRSRDAYLRNYGIPATETLAAERLAEITTHDDYVLVWGWNTNIIYLAGRKSPTRFGFSMPLLMGPGTKVRDRYRTEFMQAVGEKPIKYVVVGEIAETILGKKYELDDFPEFHDFLLQNFEPADDFDEVTLWAAKRSSKVETDVAAEMQ